jgi:signal transduction histidine kinase
MENQIQDNPSARRILLVDDEKDIRDVLSISLTDMGYDVLQADNGPTAVDLFKKNKPLIVMTDIKMPGMNGIEILKTVKAENPYVQVIMITGHGDTDIAIKSLKNDAFDFITKPISNDALEVSLKRARDKILMQQQLEQYMRNLEDLVREKTMLQDHLSSLGVMIGSISHSVKGHLTQLDAGLYLARSAIKKDNPEQLNEGLDILKVSIHRIKKLIFDILYYSKERDLNLEEFNLIKFAGDIVDICEPKAVPYQIKIHRDFDAAPERLTADPGFLRSALINILDNAIDACIQDTDSDEPHAIHFIISQETNDICFEIRDNGVGMDQETREKIFNLFFSSKQDKGTGFGLFISKNIIKQHGGTINIKSIKGRGTSFYIKLPGSS